MSVKHIVLFFSHKHKTQLDKIGHNKIGLVEIVGPV